MHSRATNSGPPASDWRALRALVGGGGPRPEPSEALASAAGLGQVELLALEAEPALVSWLGRAAEVRQRHAMLLSLAEARVQEVLNAASIEGWAALKGTATARTLYSDPAHRTRRDVDILIDAHDMPAFTTAALAAGWTDETHAEHLANAPDGPHEREWTIPIGPARVGCDVHRRLLRWREFPVNVPELLARAHRLESGWRVCAPSDLLVHTALHAANAAFCVPLRSWLDIQRLVASPAFDWDSTVRSATQWRARRCVWAALCVTQRWFGATVPDEVLATLAPRDRRGRLLVDALQGEEAWPTTVPSTGRLARARTRMLVRDSGLDAMRYVWQTASRELAMWLGA